MYYRLIQRKLISFLLLRSETGLLFFLGWVGGVGGMVRLASKRVWASHSDTFQSMIYDYNLYFE